jgi:hypothetical protein
VSWMAAVLVTEGLAASPGVHIDRRELDLSVRVRFQEMSDEHIRKISTSSTTGDSAYSV